MSLRHAPLLLTAAVFAVALQACHEYNLVSLPGYLGKEFYAVDLNNYDGSTELDSADGAQFSVTVSNPITSGGKATVSIHQRGEEEDSLRVSIEPGELEIFDLPRWDAEDSFYGQRSFYVESSVPVTAHQFNPANNEGVFSNDASMLLPLHSLGMRYRAACWPYDVSGPTADQWSGFADFITIVATEEDTLVRVVPNADIRAGDGVPAVQAGALLEMTLGEADVLQVESDNTHEDDGRSDLTGSLITSDKPIAVFSGNECALIPGGVMACDHIEEQLFPVEQWGQRFFISKFEPRKTEDDLFRIIADEDGTEIESNPPIDGFPVTLDGGDFFEFVHDGDFEISASSAVSVVQYMVGSQYCGEDFFAIGDPAMLIALPEEQFIDEYIFLTPDRYLEDYINVIAPEGAQITMDDVELDAQWEAFPSGDAVRARVEMEPGVHHLKSSQPMGVIVYGYDDDVSYAYPGGAQLVPLEEEH
jgi:hypothetical protein